MHLFRSQFENLLNSFIIASFSNSVSDNYSDTNSDKSIGLRLDVPTDKPTRTDVRIDRQITNIRNGTHKTTLTNRHTNGRLARYEKRLSDDREKSGAKIRNRSSIASDKDRKFVDAKVLDELSGY